MARFMGINSDTGLLIARIGIGMSFILIHGYPKVVGGVDTWIQLGTAINDLGMPFPTVFWGFLAAVSEFGGGILIILGLLTRQAAFLLLTTMLVAIYFHFGKGEGWQEASHALELAFFFLGLLVGGAGKYSLDHRLK